MRLIIKHAFKSVLSSKIFTPVIVAIILLSGITYTLFQSTANSFRASYNHLVQDGNLHDAVVKEKYTIKGKFNLFPYLDPGDKRVPNIDFISPPGDRMGTRIYVNVQKDPANDFYNWFLKNKWIDNGTTPQTIKIIMVYVPIQDSDLEKARKNLEAATKAEIQKLSSFVRQQVEQTKRIYFVNELQNNYGTQLHVTSTQSVAVVNDKNAYKVITSDTIDSANATTDAILGKTATQAKNTNPQGENPYDVNKLVVYDGTPLFTQDLSSKVLFNQLAFLVEQRYHKHKEITPNDPGVDGSKGYRWTYQGLLGTVSVTDPSSYEAVLSPGYANVHNKLAINPLKVLDLYNAGVMTQLQSPSDVPGLASKYGFSDQNLVWVDHTPFFIIGIGTTPDFAFPIVDQSHPIPDVNSQFLLFTNKRGYQRTSDAWRNAPQENYLSIKFDPNISAAQQQKLKSQITSDARKEMNWPSNVQIVTNYNDTNDNILLTGERVAFLKSIQSFVQLLSIITTTLLIIFVASIVILVFKSIISLKRKAMATLLALGYTRNKIAFSFACVALAIAGLPSAFGYALGHFLQYPVINAFINYWTIPIYGNAFSWFSLILVGIVPIVMLFPLIYLISFWELRHNVTKMLANNIEQYNFTPTLLKPFKTLGIQSKYSVALVFNNFWRLILLGITGIAAGSSLMVGLASINKANFAYHQTLDFSNYTYKVNLYTPTKEGGGYATTNYENLPGLPLEPTYTGDASGNPVFNPHVDHTIPYWHVPSQYDAQLAEPQFIQKLSDGELRLAAEYLKYKIQTKPLLNISVGGFNPWDIAQKLMPDNQRNTANANALEFMGNNVPNPKMKNGEFTQSFKNYFRNRFHTAPVSLYTITYQNVMLGVQDETYTYIGAQYNNGGQIINYDITGYKPNTKYLNVPQALTQKLQSYEENTHAGDANAPIPILVNQYIATTLNVGVGSLIKMDVTNNVNRFQPGVKPQKKAFVVLGMINTYDDKGIYTLQSIADQVTGVKTFNGVFSKDAKPKVLGSLPLYSPSGIYLATDSIYGNWIIILDKIIKDNNIWNKRNPGVHSAQDFLSTYCGGGKTPLVSALSSVTWRFGNEYNFKNISLLSSYLIVIIQSISIIMSIMFTIVVSALFVEANRKKIATLLSIGYHKREIIKMFVKTYTLPLVVTLLAVPISIAVLSAMRLLIINFGHVLIPFALTWWVPIVAVGLIGIIFWGSLFLCVMTMDNQRTLKALKGE